MTEENGHGGEDAQACHRNPTSSKTDHAEKQLFHLPHGYLLLVIQHLILTQLCFPMHSFFIELRNETQIPQNFWFYYSYMGARGYNQEGLQDDAS